MTNNGYISFDESVSAETVVCPTTPMGPGLIIPIDIAPSISHEWQKELHAITADDIPITKAVDEMLYMAFPNMLAFMASYAGNLITFGCLSAEHDPMLLGAVGLGSLVGNIFGFSIGVGLTSVIDTLVSQSVGARNHELSVIHLNRAKLIALIISVPCFMVLWFTEPLLVLLQQNEETARLAGEFVQGTCWGLLPYFFCNALNSYMRCYGRTGPPVIINVISALFHFAITYTAVSVYHLRAYGAGICISITYYFRWVLSEIAMWWDPRTRAATRWTSNSLNRNGLSRYMELALSNSVLLIIEWGAYELQALIAGWVGTEDLASHVAGANVVTAVFMAAIGISQAAATLVGIALGENKPKTAKIFASVIVVFTVGLYSIVSVSIILCRDFIARLVGSDPQMVEILRTKLLIAIGIFCIFDSLNVVAEGVVRGMGLQQKAVGFKFLTMLGIRLPIGYFLSRRIGVTGIWIGAIAGMSSSCLAMAWIIVSGSFAKCAQIAINRQEDERPLDNLHHRLLPRIQEHSFVNQHS